MITSENLIIRRFEETDFENLRRLESNYEVMKNTGPGKVQTADETLKNLNRYIQGVPSRFEGYWAIERKNSLEFVGFIMLRRDCEQDLELGFMLVQKYWGVGYATQASLSLVSWYRASTNGLILVAKTGSSNTASQRVLEKIGFTKQVLNNLSSSKTSVNYKLCL